MFDEHLELKKDTTIISLCLQIGCFGLCIFIILASRHILLSVSPQVLNLTKTQKTMGTMYQGLKTDRKQALNYTSLFLLQRLFIAAAAQVPLLAGQMALHQFSSMAMIAYVATCRPFVSPNDKNLAIFNLTALIILTDQVFWFTDYVPLKHKNRFGMYYTGTF
jgi:hypothetical protein